MFRKLLKTIVPISVKLFITANAAGYLQMTNPDNPTASNQKYKKVNKR